MNLKKLIFCYVLQVLAVATLGILLMPVMKVEGIASAGVMDSVILVGDWVYMEDYLFGIAGLITLITCPLLIIVTELYKLSACGIIKNRVYDMVLYITSIVLAFIVVGTVVNMFLALGRTRGMSGLKLFKGTTNFEYATPYFYLHTAFALTMLTISAINLPGKKD